MGVGMGQHVGGGGMGVGMGMGMGMSVGIGRNMGRGGMGMGAGMGQHGMSLGNAAGAPWSAGPMHAGGAGPVHSSPSAHAAAGARGPHGHGFMQAAGVSGGADADMFGDLLDMPRQGPAPKGPMRGIAESKGKGASGHHDGAGNGGSADLLGL